MKIVIGIIFIIMIMCFMCFCMCLTSIVILSNNNDFKREYCVEWEKDNSLEEEPFGWCK